MNAINDASASGILNHNFFADKAVVDTQQLSGGYNHGVYKVKTKAGQFIARLNLSSNSNAADAKSLIIEQQIQNAVATLGLAPKMLLCQGALSIVEFVAGNHQLAHCWSASQLHQFAIDLARIHQLTPSADINQLSLPTHFTDYIQQLKLTKKDKKAIAKVIAALELLDNKVSTLGLCHNDLNPLNVIVDQQNTKHFIIDWEGGCYADVFFDLAGFILEHKLTAQQQQSFLNAYFTEQHFNLSETTIADKLMVMRDAYRLICRLWHMAHQQQTG